MNFKMHLNMYFKNVKKFVQIYTKSPKYHVYKLGNRFNTITNRSVIKI